MFRNLTELRLEGISGDYFVRYPVEPTTVMDRYALPIEATNLAHAYAEGTLAIYVGVPFCASLCSFCDLGTLRLKPDDIERYVARICEDIAHYARYEDATLPVRSVYLGGGDINRIPMVLVQKVMETLHEHFRLDADTEVTMEVNPECFAVEDAQRYSAAGVTRISMGVQTYDDYMLSVMNRSLPENIDEVLQAVSEAVRVAAVDLIYVWPDEECTIGLVVRDIERAAAAGVSTISPSVFRYPHSNKQFSVAARDTYLEAAPLVQSTLKRLGFTRHSGQLWCRTPEAAFQYAEVEWAFPQGRTLGLGIGAQTYNFNGYVWDNPTREREFYADGRALGRAMTLSDYWVKGMALGMKMAHFDAPTFMQTFDVGPIGMLTSLLERHASGVTIEELGVSILPDGTLFNDSAFIADTDVLGWLLSGDVGSYKTNQRPDRLRTIPPIVGA